MNTNNTPTPATPIFDQNPSAISAPDHRPLLDWTAPASHAGERSHRWYVGCAIVVLAVAAFAIVTAAWSLALPTVLIGGLYYMQRKQPESMHTIRLEEGGVQYDDLFVNWKDIADAYFVQTAPGPVLYLKRRKGMPREIRILAPEIGVPKIRAVLSRFLTVGSDRHEHVLDLLIRLCKL